MSVKDKVEEWWIASEFAFSKTQFIAAISLSVLIIAGWLIYHFQQPAVSADIKVVTPTAKKASPAVTSQVFVHVAGAVKNPGVYKISEGSRIIEAVNKAGGFAKGADENSLNLAAKVKDSQKIEVLIKQPTSSSGVSSATSVRQDNQIINLNTATEDQLDELPGIGETMAKRIIEFRQDKGSFTSVDQLKDIEGIGDKKFERLKDKVAI